MRLSIWAVGIAAIVASGSTFAADLDLPTHKAPPPVAPFAAPTYDWTGFYLGVSGGYGWGQATWTDQNDGDFANFLGQQYSTQPKGGVLGGHVGYDKQFDHIVLGAELSGSTAWTMGTVENPVVHRVFGTTHVHALYAATAKLGYAVDRLLEYGKGGLAFAQMNILGNDTIANIQFSDSQLRPGLTLGAGLEYAMTNNWLAGLEYDYYDFGDPHFRGYDNGTGGFNNDFNAFKVNTKINTINARISYKF
jgi:outer membrane immunogenic protein